MTTKAYALITAVAILLLAAPASRADMELGMQDDEAMKYQTADYLARADYAGATWIRLMAQDNRWNAGEANAYVNAAAQAQAHGKHVMVSLMAWQSHPTAAEWRAFAEQVFARMDPYVDVWSPMNEPNYPGMAPYTGTRCIETTGPSTVGVSGRKRVPRGWRKVRRGHGRYLRHVKHRAGRTVVRFRKARTRKQRARARWIHTHRRSRPTTVYVTTTEARRACTAEAFGVAYRRVWDQVAPMLAQSGKPLVVGDLCPGPAEAFMAAFYASGEPATRPSIFGDHYPGPEKARWVVEYAQAHGMVPWVTEWAQTAWDLFNPEIHSVPEDWVRALDRFEAIGIRVTMIYDTNVPTWDTRMDDDALEAVAGR